MYSSVRCSSAVGCCFAYDDICTHTLIVFYTPELSGDLLRLCCSLHVGAHLGPCPVLVVHGAARRGLQPLRYQCLLDRRGDLLKTRAFSELGGILRT